MENVIIVSGNKSASESLSDFFTESFQCNPRHAESASHAYSIFESGAEFELAVVNAPLPDESGMRLCEYISDNTSAFCMLIVKSENAARLSDFADKNNIVLVPRPFSKASLYQSVKLIEISLRRYFKLYQEAARLEQKIDEVRRIDKAKFMLMEYKKMSEQQAHSFIEKYAMNIRKKKSLAAYEIINKLTEEYM
ncbi:MAG: ANTAR domain-containing protein [Oscillospiraceae bacterium]|nr:ANTAR domain-containing protein [Oscillospiraceae bacterium]